MLKSAWRGPGARIVGLGTAVPERSGSRDRARAFMGRVAEARAARGDRERVLRTIDLVSRKSGVEHRHTVVPDFLADDPSEFQFFSKNWALFPDTSTGARMELYRSVSPELAVRAAERALAHSGIDRERVTHVLLSTCTGFFAPGLDVELVRRLGLSGSTARTIIGFMGCQASFNGLRMADEITRAHPDAVVLQVSVELCSIHFQAEPTPENIVANSLFADGAGALVYTGRGEGLAAVRRTHSCLVPEHSDQMTWRIGDAGFAMYLDGSVPASLRARIESSTDELLSGALLTRQDVRHWLAHPGGPRILDALERALDLAPDALASSRAVLKDFGNMSSATIIFVLERVLTEGRAPGALVAMGFGPGLTIESCVLEVLA